MKVVLSFGGGVNSTAVLAKYYYAIDYCVFADPGHELPETYQYIEDHIKPFCQEHEIEFIHLKTRRDGLDLYDYYFENKLIPFFSNKSCTDYFKIKPIRQWILNNLDIDNTLVYIGYAFDESQRAKNIGGSYYCATPLIQDKISREKCKKIIHKTIGPIPPKSGCYFCASAPLKFYRWLYREHEDLWQKVLKLEKNGRRYPEITIKPHNKLEDTKKARKEDFIDNGYIMEFEPDGGYCVMCI